VSGCEIPATFQGLTPSPTSGFCWGLGKTKTDNQVSYSVLCLSAFCVGMGWNAIPLREYFYSYLSTQNLKDLRHQRLYLYLNINPLGPELLYKQTGLTLTNPTFCPHSVFTYFVWIWEQTAIISLYSINWRVFIIEAESVYWEVRIICFIYISEQIAIISLYSINWLVFVTDTVCVYCAVRTEYLINSGWS
jgi:hypothetical protein